MKPTVTYPLPIPRYDLGRYRYFFNGQESDAEVYGSGSLAGYEFRQYDTRLGRWWGIDRKSAKYPSLSPYQFCAGNPIVLVDSKGDSIDPVSKDDWYKQKLEITATIVNRVFQVVTNTQVYNLSYIKTSSMSLFRTLSIMDQMERHPIWWFSLLSKAEGTTGFTRLTRDLNHKKGYLFVIGHVNTANFVHEVTHCGQFLSGEIVFEEHEGGFGAYVDIYDELEAYQFQYYYDQFSLPRNNYPIFTEKWLRDIKDDEGKYPYREDGLISFDKFATKEIMQEAYPEIFEEFEDMKGPLMCKPRTVSNW